MVLTFVVRTVEVVYPVGETEAEEVMDALTDVGDVLSEVPVGQTHPPVAKLVIGGTVQVAAKAHEEIEDVAGVLSSFAALTKTGMTAPVARLKGICPRTASRLAPSPE